MRFRVWFRALRVPFFTGTLVPIVFGTAFAYYWKQTFSIWRFILVFVGTLLVQAGLNLANDYFDFLSGNDSLDKPTPFSGGSRVIQDGLIKPKSILLACALCMTGAAVVGLYLNFTVRGNFILIIGLVGMLLASFYSAPPLRIGYRRGLAEFVCALGCGPILILGSFYAQAETFSLAALLASLPMGILIGLILFINEFPDYEADRRVNKNTLVVTCGPRKASRVFVMLLVTVYIITVVLILMGIFPEITLIVLITIPLAVFVLQKLLAYHNNIKKLLPANIAMIRLHLLFSAMSISALLI